MKTCKECGYAYEGEKCTNPACKTVNPEAHARHVARAKEEAEAREARLRIYRSYAK